MTRFLALKIQLGQKTWQTLRSQNPSSVTHFYTLHSSTVGHFTENLSYLWIINLKSDLPRSSWRTNICTYNIPLDHNLFFIFFYCDLPTNHKIWVMLCTNSNFLMPNQQQYNPKINVICFNWPTVHVWKSSEHDISRGLPMMSKTRNKSAFQ